MLDITWIRQDPQALDRALADRGAEPAAQRLIDLDDERRAHIRQLQEAQNARNQASKQIGKAKASGDEAAAQNLIDEVAKLKSAIQEGEAQERALEEALRTALAEIPNVPLPDVPVGPDETANVELRLFGDPMLSDSAPEHYEIGEALGLMDFESAAKLSGSRFVVLKGQLARLERALGQFMLDLHTSEHGYTEVAPPTLVRDDALFGTAQLPKFTEDLYATAAVDDDEAAAARLWLIPTAEVPLTNLVRETILEEAELPLRFTALTPCFRSEAGSAGRDTRGMLRQHQFNKVELVSITSQQASFEEHERMTACAETVLKKLGLPYRVMVLSTGDMGFAARRTYDIEVWLPGQGAYREISSCSVCGDFQARRMNARYRAEGEKQPKFVHTLNGSGVAVGRALIAVMENYRNDDGSITVPEVLRRYMGGVERIGA
ncbi:serine--tRNA ligase [Afifella sp. JA880]|uniref:serine--tRNA ligase n=1 Tax=Afifella sp. JA880 TaxID=2975280 RepID=UPI0021BB46B1|nr:serine--tRNA ligase [Afifella sp. JA880]MCT8265772.1 serine--tRNA ligase [Afifella sp. JA880]